MLAWVMNLGFAGGGASPTPKPIVFGGGSVPGFIPGERGPVKRKHQVFGEEYPIASDVVHSDGTASLRDLAQSDLLDANSMRTQGPTGGAFGDIEGRVLDAVLTDSEKAALGLLWAMMLSLDS